MLVQENRKSEQQFIDYFKNSFQAVQKLNVYDQIDFWLNYNHKILNDPVMVVIFGCIKDEKIKDFVITYMKSEMKTLKSLKDKVFVKSDILLELILDLKQFISFLDNETDGDFPIYLIQMLLEDKFKFWESVLKEL